MCQQSEEAYPASNTQHILLDFQLPQTSQLGEATPVNSLDPNEQPLDQTKKNIKVTIELKNSASYMLQFCVVVGGGGPTWCPQANIENFMCRIIGCIFVDELSAQFEVEISKKKVAVWANKIIHL